MSLPQGRRAGRFRESSVLLIITAVALVAGACRPATPTAGVEPAGGTAAAVDTQVGTAPAPATAPAGDAAPGAGATAVPPPTAGAAAEATARQATAAAAVLPTWEEVFGVAGTNPGQIMLPFDVAVDPRDGSRYVSDSTGVQKFAADGTFIRRVGEGDLPLAEGIAVAPDGRLYVTGYGAQVLVFDADGNPLGSLGSVGDGPGQFKRPTDAAVDADGNVFVVDAGNARVEKFGPDGRFLMSIGERGDQSGQFMSPRVVAVDGLGRVYVGMGDDFLVQRFEPDGSYRDTFGQGTLDETLYRTGGIAVDAESRAYVSQSMSHAVQVFDVADAPRLIGELGGQAGISYGQFNSPTGVTVAGDRLLVADTRNNRVQAFVVR